MTIDLIISRLKKRYPPGKFHSSDPFRVLIATVLSQRTRDEVTDRAAEKLFAKYGSPGALAQADVVDIEKLIRAVGFYRVKAPRVKEIARIISNDFKGKDLTIWIRCSRFRAWEERQPIVYWFTGSARMR